MTAFVLIFYESPAGAFPTSGQAPRTIFARGARLSYSALPACVAAGGPEGGPPCVLHGPGGGTYPGQLQAAPEPLTEKTVPVQSGTARKTGGLSRDKGEKRRDAQGCGNALGVPLFFEPIRLKFRQKFQCCLLQRHRLFRRTGSGAGSGSRRCRCCP